jgi:hypothetical protein
MAIGARLELEAVLDPTEPSWNEAIGASLADQLATSLGSGWQLVGAAPYEGHLSVPLPELTCEAVDAVAATIGDVPYFELTVFQKRKVVMTCVGSTPFEVADRLSRLTKHLENDDYQVRGTTIEAVIGCWKPVGPDVDGCV